MSNTVSLHNTSDIFALFRSHKMIEESAGQHLKDIENTLQVQRLGEFFNL